MMTRTNSFLQAARRLAKRAGLQLRKLRDDQGYELASPAWRAPLTFETIEEALAELRMQAR